MTLRKFIRNIDLAVHNSFILSLIYVAILYGLVFLVILWIVMNPTLETFATILGLIVVRFLYAGYTGR